MSTASLVVLGSGTGIPTIRRGPPGLLLDPGDGGTVLIDPGSGTLGRAARSGTPVEKVDRVLITHLHPDHTLDLAALLFARKNTWLMDRLKPLTLAGPEGTKAFYQRMVGLYGRWVKARDDQFRILEVKPSRALPGGLGFSGVAYKTEHTEESLGYRIELPSGTLALSGDTGPCDALKDLGQGADLFLLECAVPDGFDTDGKHMTPSHAGKAAARANPGRLVLYHLYPPVEAGEALRSIKRFWDGDAVVAEDGMTFTV